MSVPLRPLSALEVECHRLLRLIVRAYYDPLHVLVVESLLHLVRVPSLKLLNDSAIAAQIGLSVRVVRSALGDLKNDQLIHATAISNERTDAEKDALSERLIRRGVVRRERFDGAFSVDCEMLLMIVKYRHSAIHTALNMRHDETGVSYECVTPSCPMRGIARPLINLLVEAPGQSDFRCQSCQRTNDRGELEYSPLVSVENPLQTSQLDRERLLHKFNARKSLIDKQLKAADAIADATRETDGAAVIDGQTAAPEASAPALMADIEVDIADAHQPSLYASSAPSSASVIGTNRVLHAPTIRADTAKGTVAALPWMATQTRPPDSAVSAPTQHNAVDAGAVALEYEQLRAAAASNTVNSPSASVSDTGAGGYVHIGGRLVPYHQITDDDVRNMTASEQAEYEAVANDMGED